MKVKVLENVRYKDESHATGSIIEMDKKDVEMLEDSKIIEVVESKSTKSK